MEPIILELEAFYLEKEKRIIKMREILFYGKETSIYDSLKGIAKFKNNFIIKKEEIIRYKNLKDQIFLLDDSYENFLKFIKIFPDNKKNNLIITTRKDNISLESAKNLRIFFKPVKILDIYKVIEKRIKKNVNNYNIFLNIPRQTLSSPTGKNLRLTEKEFKLIEILLNNNGKPISKKDILANVWGLETNKVSTLNTRVLETLISRIRRKIKSAKIKVALKKDKKGYMLVENV